MKLKVAAGAPDIVPERAALQENILSLIRRARSDEAIMLVLPANLPEDIDMAAVEEAAGSMPVYPLTAKGLTAEELPAAAGLDFYCCCANTPATASSHFELEELVAGASHDKQAVVILAAPKGGNGGLVYSGQCVIAQNGYVLRSTESGYALAELRTSKSVKRPVEGTVDGQPTTPWTPLPDMIPRLLALQSDALARRMHTANQTHAFLSMTNDPDSLLALATAATAADLLSLPRKNIRVSVTGEDAAAMAAELGVSLCDRVSGLRLAPTNLTSRSIRNAQPLGYAVNGTIPRSVICLMLRYYAATCGNRALSAPIWSVLDRDYRPWELFDFMLYFAMAYDFPADITPLLEETFPKYKKSVIQEAKTDFFAHYQKPTVPDGPLLFRACLGGKG